MSLKSKEKGKRKREEITANNEHKKPYLEGRAYEELSKKLKDRKAYLKSIPHFTLKPIGEDASLRTPDDKRRPLGIRDLQSLLLYAMMGTEAPVEPGRWAKFLQWSKLTKIKCLIIDGLGTTDFNSSERLTSIKSVLSHQLEFLSPFAYNSTVSNELSTLPISVRRTKEILKKQGSVRKGIKQGAAFKIKENLCKVKEEARVHQAAKIIENPTKLKLMLSTTQMVSENYPFHTVSGIPNSKTLDYVFSKDEYAPVTEKSPLFAVDCEMCLTTIGKLELTKVCVVDSDLNEVYHSFVKPHNPITDYLTQYSGITPAMLQDVEVRLKDVQEALRRLLPADAIWIGQSLNGDLHALQMMHPYVIDTSVIYNITGIPGRKTKLKILSKIYLREIIQDKGSEGHDPKEDAIAAMKLVLLKLDKGLTFGDALTDENTKKELMKIKNDEGVEILSTSFFKEVKDKKRTMAITSTQEILAEYKKYWSPEEEPNVMLFEAENGKKAIETSSSHTNCLLSLCHVSPSGSDEKRMIKAKNWTKKVWSSTPQNGLFITVWSGGPTQTAFVGLSIKKKTDE